MKIKLNVDDNLPLTKPLKFPAMNIIIGSVFEKIVNVIYNLFQTILCMRQCKNVAVRKIDISEEIDVKKSSLSKYCELCHYWYFKDVGFRFEPHVCNKCHDVLMTAHELKNIAVLSVGGADFRCIFCGISREEAVNRLNNSVLENKGVV